MFKNIMRKDTLVDDVIIRYTNDITVGNSSKMATLRAIKGNEESQEKIKLPDLF